MSPTKSNIWQLRAQGNVEGILKALDETDPGVRRRAIIALRDMKAGEAIPRLKMLLEREFNPELRGILVGAIEALEGKAELQPQPATPPDHRAELVKILQTGNDEERITAIQELSKLDDRTVVEHLVAIFRTPLLSPSVRLAAAEALLALDSAPASVSLLGALRKSEWQVRRNAVAVLGQLKADWCVETLADVLRTDPHPMVRKTAAAALRHINTRQARAVLKQCEDIIASLHYSGTTGPLLSAPDNVKPDASAREDNR
ncbi:MAG: HEAT repeat domain-containing protein [Anaerolineae bacterium]|nr:HEAT repeat domain-containing protein [Anaerolineae bacterium]